MIIFVVMGVNNLTSSAGPVGAGTTRELAQEVAKEKEYLLDDYKIFEVEVRTESQLSPEIKREKDEGPWFGGDVIEPTGGY